MTALAIALAVLVGLTLGMLGGGGSILTVPLLVYVAGLDAKAAIATSLLVVGVTSAVGAVSHARAGRVQWRTGLIFGAAGMVGAYTGGRVAHYIPGEILLLAFAAMMIATSVAMLRGRREVEAAKVHHQLPVARVLLDGVVVGLVTGLVGAGGGFLVVPALALLGGLSRGCSRSASGPKPKPRVGRLPAHDVRALLQALGHDGDRREAAIARLTILGTRVVPQLIAEFSRTDDRDRQIAVLRVLEAAADERTVPVAEAAIAAGGDVAVAAVALLRELLTRTVRGADVKALDLLLSLARDGTRDRRLRAAAREALDAAPQDVRDALGALGTSEDQGEALWQDALGGHLPDDVRQLRDAIATHAETAPLPDLRRLIERMVERERAQKKAPAIAEWRAARGAVHQALALRGSRVALYDLREAFEQASGALPSSFIGAVSLVGDESCVEPLASAYANAGGDARWQQQLAQAFREVVKRERITKKHSALRRALGKAPALDASRNNQ
jgi:hypothetical protein